MRQPPTQPTLAAAGPGGSGITLDEESDEDMGLPHEGRDTSGYINSDEQNLDLPEQSVDRFNEVQNL